MRIVSFKIVRSDGGPEEELTDIATGLTGELQPCGVPYREVQSGDAGESYFDLLSDGYAGGIKPGDLVQTVNGEDEVIDTYKIVDVEDYGDQLDLKLRLI
jgi:hypothetical protein